MGRVHRSHPPCNQLKALASATVTSVVLADEATKCPNEAQHGWLYTYTYLSEFIYNIYSARHWEGEFT